jgi:hypothetical protein
VPGDETFKLLPEARPVTVPVRITHGVRVLRRLLRERTSDLRTLDLAGFRAWLGHHLARWENDPVFAQRVRIRDLGRAHPRLHDLKTAYRRAAAADAAAAPFARLRRLEQELIDTGKAIAGLTASLERAPAEKQSALRDKRDAFQAREHILREEQTRLIESSPQRQTLLRAGAELEQFRAAIGLHRAEEHLEQLLKRQGRRSGHSGASFEELAHTVTQSHIIPDLLRGRSRDGALRRLRVLRQVTLGAARVEFDQVVIRQPRHSDVPVEVLAVVEVKRNINDLAHGFRQRQENLAWLTGATDHYDAGLYRNGRFPSGQFDRPAVHRQDADVFPFDRGSFRHFRRDPAAGLILRRLYFITRAGTLWGISHAALTRIGFRVATDPRWQPDQDAYVRELLHRCQALAQAVETPDVLQTYAATPRLGRQILLVDR